VHAHGSLHQDRCRSEGLVVSWSCRLVCWSVTVVDAVRDCQPKTAMLTAIAVDMRSMSHQRKRRVDARRDRNACSICTLIVLHSSTRSGAVFARYKTVSTSAGTARRIVPRAGSLASRRTLVQEIRRYRRMFPQHAIAARRPIERPTLGRNVIGSLHVRPGSVVVAVVDVWSWWSCRCRRQLMTLSWNSRGGCARRCDRRGDSCCRVSTRWSQQSQSHYDRRWIT